MENLSRNMYAVLAAAQEVTGGKIITDALNQVIRQCLSVERIFGPLKELYPILEDIFTSLPPAEMVYNYFSGSDTQTLREWVKEREGEADEAHIEIKHRDVTMITPTSGRRISFFEPVSGKEDIVVYIDFPGGSINAAYSVIEDLFSSNPQTVSKYVPTVPDMVFSVSDIRADIGEWMSDSYSHETREVRITRYNRVAVVHAPDWLLAYLDISGGFVCL